MYEFRCSMITYTYIYTLFTGVTLPPLLYPFPPPLSFTILHVYHDMDYTLYFKVLLMT